ncbi:MAG: crossover junction endodeoxyribonuclease RuvC [Leptospirales bacterium]
MIFLGLDPGYARLGFGVVQTGQTGKTETKANAHSMPKYVDCGVIETPSTEKEPARLATIEAKLTELLHKYNVECCAVEKLYFGKNLTTGVSVLQARGVLLLTLHKFNIAPIEVSPNEVKKMISGFGHAGKSQMQLVVKNILKLKEIPKPDDAADGLALALYAWLYNRNHKIHRGV